MRQSAKNLPKKAHDVLFMKNILVFYLENDQLQFIDLNASKKIRVSKAWK